MLGSVPAVAPALCSAVAGPLRSLRLSRQVLELFSRISSHQHSKMDGDGRHKETTDQVLRGIG